MLLSSLRHPQYNLSSRINNSSSSDSLPCLSSSRAATVPPRLEARPHTMQRRRPRTRTDLPLPTLPPAHTHLLSTPVTPLLLRNRPSRARTPLLNLAECRPLLPPPYWLPLRPRAHPPPHGAE